MVALLQRVEVYPQSYDGSSFTAIAQSYFCLLDIGSIHSRLPIRVKEQLPFSRIGRRPEAQLGGWLATSRNTGTGKYDPMAH